jgi:hypothetical protein
MVLAFAGDSTITSDVEPGSDGPSSSTIRAAAPFLPRVGFIATLLAGILLAPTVFVAVAATGLVVSAATDFVARFVVVFVLAVLAFAI